MRALAATSIVVLLAAPAAFAQERGSAASNERAAAEKRVAAEKLTAELAARVPLEQPIKGAPYSADVQTQSTQTLADGNHISQKTTGHVYRDSQGRTRREDERVFTTRTPNGPSSIAVTTISIVDPVGGYSYSLNPEQKIAWRTPIGASAELLDKIKASMAAGAQGRGQPELTPEQKTAAAAETLAKLQAERDEKIAAAKERAAQSTDPQSQASSESIARGRSGGPGERGGAPAGAVMRGRGYIMPNTPLEHATIDGLAVEGHRSSETIPAGQIGNEQPIVITSEEWRSTDLQVLVLTKHNDPRTGESTYRLANVVRAEPDPSLFMVPPDYTVKDTGIRRNNQ